MSCEPIVGADGRTVRLACTRGRKHAACSVPGCGREHTKLCDYALTNTSSGTCDAKLCDAHASRVGPDRDYCPPHARLAQVAPPVPFPEPPVPEPPDWMRSGK